MEDQLRLISFLTLFAVLAIGETLKPAWPQKTKRTKRWPLNIALLLIGLILIRALFSLSLIEAALWAQSKHWGLLNQFSAPTLFSAVVAYLLLDIAIYWQHVASHKIPILWRFHKVHHADTALDVSSALRFHPVEGLVSMAYKALVVTAIGAPLIAVLIFELALNLGASFNHANVHIPQKIDNTLRRWLVTPSFHRSHHSPDPMKTNSNYGFLLPWWDYLFNSHTPLDTNDRGEVGLALANELNADKLKDCLLGIPRQS